MFDRLHAGTVSSRLLPGTRSSEVDVAPQPVPEASIRLHDLDMLQVKPQRATRVRRISEPALLDARFIRTAVETAEMQGILADHERLVDCVRHDRAAEAESLVRRHLSRVIDLLGSVRT